MSEPKYPEVEVELSDQDGNAVLIIGRVIKARRKAGASNEDVTAMTTQAMSGDYAHLLNTVGQWVEIK